MFDRLSEHYYNNFDEFTRSKNDISEIDEHAIAVIFSKMAQYYSTSERKAVNPYADDLWLVYDELMNAFGIKAEDEDTSTTPESIEDLEELLDRLEGYVVDKKKLISE